MYNIILCTQVLLKTSLGDIDIELWSKEAPLASRNFVQLCMEGYYNETVFHRVIEGITQPCHTSTCLVLCMEGYYNETVFHKSNRRYYPALPH